MRRSGGGSQEEGEGRGIRSCPQGGARRLGLTPGSDEGGGHAADGGEGIDKLDVSRSGGGGDRGCGIESPPSRTKRRGNRWSRRSLKPSPRRRGVSSASSASRRRAGSTNPPGVDDDKDDRDDRDDRDHDMKMAESSPWWSRRRRRKSRIPPRRRRDSPSGRLSIGARVGGHRDIALALLRGRRRGDDGDLFVIVVRIHRAPRSPGRWRGRRRRSPRR